jgi:hypothetical protein
MLKLEKKNAKNIIICFTFLSMNTKIVANTTIILFPDDEDFCYMDIGMLLCAIIIAVPNFWCE